MQGTSMQSIAWVAAGIALTLGAVFIVGDLRSTFFAGDEAGEEVARLQEELAKRDSYVAELEQIIRTTDEGDLLGAEVVEETFEKIQDASVRNQQKWLQVEQAWEAQNIQLAQGQEELAESFVSFINTVAMSMVDPTFDNSLYNDFLRLIPDQPLLYSQELIDVQEVFALEAAFLWPLFLCDFIKKNYVATGFVRAEGENCVRIRQEFQAFH